MRWGKKQENALREKYGDRKKQKATIVRKKKDVVLQRSIAGIGEN